MKKEEQAFIDKLIELTKSGSIRWKRDTESQYNKFGFTGAHKDMNFVLQYHPCLWRLEVKGLWHMVIENLHVTTLVEAVETQTVTRQEDLASHLLRVLSR